MHHIRRPRARLAAALAVAALAGALAVPFGLAAGALAPAAAHRAPAHLVVVGAESQYASLLGVIGGAQVRATAVMSNPDVDPHSFEASPSVARLIASAALVVQNGLGYDSFMNRLEAASPSRTRRVITVQNVLHLPASTRNPHLWYRLDTMPAVAAAIAKDLGRLDPRHARLFRLRAQGFDQSFAAVTAAARALRRRAHHAPVATTEPVADDLLAALGLRNRTPWSLQADVMNGVDPAPQDVATEQQLLSGGEVKAFLYNAQVTDSLTATFAALARAHHVPVVAVYETMPPHHSVVSWMLDEIHAIGAALFAHRSTRSL